MGRPAPAAPRGAKGCAERGVRGAAGAWGAWGALASRVPGLPSQMRSRLEPTADREGGRRSGGIHILYYVI